GITDLTVTPALQGAFAEEIQMKNEGVPLWKWFLGLALLMLLAEFLLLRLGRTPGSSTTQTA
ncbi:MAG: hypothetical protein AAF570_19050, partial [Bacteroidota bacterium]